jgi:hypothetical protein
MSAGNKLKEVIEKKCTVTDKVQKNMVVLMLLYNIELQKD